MKSFAAIVSLLCLASCLNAAPFRQFGPWKLSRFASWEKDVLVVEVPPESARGMNVSNLTIDLEPYRGKQIAVRCLIQAENVSKPPAPYLGIKFMLPHTSGQGKKYPGAAAGIAGSFDWREFTFHLAVPADIREYSLVFGLQDASGKVRFRDLSIREAELYRPPVPVPPGFRCSYTPALRSAPVLRGAMSPPVDRFTPKDIEDLAAWGGNAVRWQFSVPRDRRTNLDLFRETTRERLADLERILPACRKHGVKIIIDMHGAPGGRYQDPTVLGTAGTLAEPATHKINPRMFEEDVYLDAYVEFWREIARRYQGDEIIFAYDLINEPTQVGAVKNDYLYCQYLAAKAIREIDPEKPVIVAANHYSDPASAAYLYPLPFQNLIYTFHMYEPGSYTHQGVRGTEKIKQGEFTIYPGVIDDVRFDREALRKVLEPVVQFQKRYGAMIYIGEFSVIRWAPNGAQYLDDVIGLFEEYGWSWTYHAFREWHGWSVEHGEDPNDNRPAAAETERKKVLLKYFQKNRP